MLQAFCIEAWLGAECVPIGQVSRLLDVPNRLKQRYVAPWHSKCNVHQSTFGPIGPKNTLFSTGSQNKFQGWSFAHANIYDPQHLKL